MPDPLRLYIFSPCLRLDAQPVGVSILRLHDPKPRQGR
jgi:hypothetical protein